ncbi:hypothetical protein AMTR_s00068p00206630 [Amborella trichopoda]|uniref:Exostosin GT47 domain-containing protein n=1 Tax=Amborella trichopoda TaxID=13333 RepID=U5D4P6_AMBTC|nr:hypothetical protein AMTR_s00068p00206630 [Amborella trichopoda]
MGASREKALKPKETFTVSKKTKLFTFISVLLLWFFLIFYLFNLEKPTNFSGLYSGHHRQQTATNGCKDGLVYVYDLPPKFNGDLLRRCENLSMYTNMCPHVANRGMGQPVQSMGPSWFATHQFLGDLMVHARVESHVCRTNDTGLATLFYVPFYGGLHASSVFREKNWGKRDGLGEELVEYLSEQAMWKRHRGRDHFVAIGRTSWDFMRDDKGIDFGANRFLLTPPLANMWVLTVERHPWHPGRQIGVPYPSYFHPAEFSEILEWQIKVRQAPRTHLYAFVGGPRPPGLEKAAARADIFSQCNISSRCLSLQCRPGASGCYEPPEVLRALSTAEFCLQPPGDSFTRRSVFDSILSGCIPVFFSPHTAYTQYQWYLPEQIGGYSVYIPPEKVGRIEEQLMRIPKARVARMRSTVIDLIPRITYARPDAGDPGFQDAIDVVLSRLARRVRAELGPSQESHGQS